MAKKIKKGEIPTSSGSTSDQIFVVDTSNLLHFKCLAFNLKDELNCLTEKWILLIQDINFLWFRENKHIGSNVMKILK